MNMNTAPMLPPDPMRTYREKRDRERRTVRSKYSVLGFISSGTYGLVFKAQALTSKDGGPGAFYAIKKFKAEKEGEAMTYTGISQSACREIAVSCATGLQDTWRCRLRYSFGYNAKLNREISNINMVKLREVILEEKSIYMVFEYAEHDFLVSFPCQ